MTLVLVHLHSTGIDLAQTESISVIIIAITYSVIGVLCQLVQLRLRHALMRAHLRTETILKR